VSGSQRAQSNAVRAAVVTSQAPRRVTSSAHSPSSYSRMPGRRRATWRVNAACTTTSSVGRTSRPNASAPLSPQSTASTGRTRRAAATHVDRSSVAVATIQTPRNSCRQAGPRSACRVSPAASARAVVNGPRANCSGTAAARTGLRVPSSRRSLKQPSTGTANLTKRAGKRTQTARFAMIGEEGSAGGVNLAEDPAEDATVVEELHRCVGG
jgi:hypothetical protein